MSTVNAPAYTLLLLLSVLAVSKPASAQSVEYYHTDALGTPVTTTDADRNILEHREYEPYGKLINGPVTDGPGFTGHVTDAATGMVYMQQRYYDPGVGRFLSVDPVTADGRGGNFNRYRYASDNPYGFNDPDGRWTTPIACNACGVRSGPIGAGGTSEGDEAGEANFAAFASNKSGAVSAGPLTQAPPPPKVVAQPKPKPKPKPTSTGPVPSKSVEVGPTYLVLDFLFGGKDNPGKDGPIESVHPELYFLGAAGVARTAALDVSGNAIRGAACTAGICASIVQGAAAEARGDTPAALNYFESQLAEDFARPREIEALQQALQRLRDVGSSP